MGSAAPVLSENDIVFPGENWFLYWKTSASLWKDKLEQLPPASHIIVPLHWAFHTDTGDSIDFGEHRPETDLKKLSDLIAESGRKAIFYLPLTPAPFLPNGGMPSLLARNLATDEDEVIRTYLGPNGDVIRHYSFFDPRVVRAFGQFASSLGVYFKEKDVLGDIWGISCMTLEDAQKKTCFGDNSKVFQDGLRRFLELKKEEFRQKNIDSDQPLISNIDDEQKFSYEFSKTVIDVYIERAKSQLKNYWEGELDIVFLGANSTDFFNRMSGQEIITKYSRDIMETLCMGALPSSLLLPSNAKAGVIKKQLNDLVLNSTLELALDADIFEHEGPGILRPLTFFEIYDHNDGEEVNHVTWADMGLWDYVIAEFGWCFKDQPISKFTFKETDEFHQKVHFFHGSSLDRAAFNRVLKLFMDGGKVILDRDDMDPQLVKRLEVFFLENEFNVEKVHYLTNVHNVVLGEGRLVIIEGNALSQVGDDDVYHFWDKLLNTFTLNQVRIRGGDGIEYFWRTRHSGMNELNYEEVRRLNIYNPTSYKKKVKIGLNSHFAFLKILDDSNAKVKHQSQEIEIEALPSASIALEFGVYT